MDIKEAKQILNGFTNLTLSKVFLSNKEIEELSSKRMNVCNNCPNLSNNTCKLCGCYMPSKTRVRKASCPDKHW